MNKTQLESLSNLCVDACRRTVSTYDAKNAKYTDLAVRQEICKILGSDKLTFQNWRRHKIDIFELVEVVLNQTLPDAWDESPFYNEMVEVKNYLLGQKNEFVVEDDSTLVVSKFSGNHWNTDRQKLPGNRSFSLPTEWFFVRVYDEFDRFLKGTVSIADMFSRLGKSVLRDIDSRVYSAFNGAGATLPAQFEETGSFDKDTMLALVERVQVASSKPVRIAGTKQGLAKMSVDPVWTSEEMKNEKYTTGKLGYWEGIHTVVIPQVFIRGTYDFKVSDNMLYVLPESFKPVKLYFEGDTRGRELGHDQTLDQTLDMQIQTKLGVGVVFDKLFGCYEIV